jgi:starch phosphorylase
MKAGANGAINCSVLDGWWDEAYTPEIGWAIGRGEDYPDDGYQDAVEADALLTLMEQEIVPLFYDRAADGIPHGWVGKMKASMAAICKQFNSNRMVMEYAERFYLPGIRRGAQLAQDDYRRAKELTAWLRTVKEGWSQVRLVEVGDNAEESVRFSDRIAVKAKLALGPLGPSDVLVQLECGRVDSAGELIEPRPARMEYIGPTADGLHQFLGTLECEGTGRWGYTVRVLPSHQDLANPFDTGCLKWA